MNQVINLSVACGVFLMPTVIFCLWISRNSNVVLPNKTIKPLADLNPERKEALAQAWAELDEIDRAYGLKPPVVAQPKVTPFAPIPMGCASCRKIFPSQGWTTCPECRVMAKANEQIRRYDKKVDLSPIDRALEAQKHQIEAIREDQKRQITAAFSAMEVQIESYRNQGYGWPSYYDSGKVDKENQIKLRTDRVYLDGPVSLFNFCQCLTWIGVAAVLLLVVTVPGLLQAVTNFVVRVLVGG